MKFSIPVNLFTMHMLQVPHLRGRTISHPTCSKLCLTVQDQVISYILCVARLTGALTRLGDVPAPEIAAPDIEALSPAAQVIPWPAIFHPTEFLLFCKVTRQGYHQTSLQTVGQQQLSLPGLHDACSKHQGNPSSTKPVLPKWVYFMLCAFRSCCELITEMGRVGCRIIGASSGAITKVVFR
jgi:hypothetical protein